MTISAREAPVRVLRLHPADNVLTLLSSVSPGESIDLEGCTIIATAALPLGHKLAARDIAVGEKVLKYGAPIGSATRRIARGEHVHTQNLQSDYLPGGEGEES